MSSNSQSLAFGTSPNFQHRCSKSTPSRHSRNVTPRDASHFNTRARVPSARAAVLHSSCHLNQHVAGLVAPRALSWRSAHGRGVLTARGTCTERTLQVQGKYELATRQVRANYKASTRDVHRSTCQVPHLYLWSTGTSTRTSLSTSREPAAYQPCTSQVLAKY